MASHRIRSLFLSSILSVVYSLAACGNNAGNSDPPLPLVTPLQAILMAGQSVQFTANANGLPASQPVWMVNGAAGGSATVGTISSTGLYIAPTTLPVVAVQVSVLDEATGLRSEPATVHLYNPSQPAVGTVAPTNNPLVALYSLEVPQGARVQVQFGQSTNYGLTTWIRPAPEAGGTVSIFVAGMRASTTYHMQGLVFLPGGTRIADSDHTFTAGALSAPGANITVQQTTGATPASGVELLCLDPSDGGNELTAVVTDLSGNVIWYYNIGAGEWPFPMKLLPNGHMLVVAAPATNSQGQIPAGSENLNEVREIDLAGNIINRITLNEINTGLTSIGASFQAASLHHDILALPNGHLILLVNHNKTFNNQPGLPAGTLVTGDALIDWDPQVGPVWTWSSFDHLDPSRLPYGIANGVADWTHSNAVIYSPDDGNVILSMRNQNWIIKINYENGAGDGSILWHFGYQGDFTLPPGQAPIEWNYGQHYPSIVSPNSAGVFDMMFFNNGNNRLADASNDICSSPGTVHCYSSVPIFQVNEYTKTAQVQWETNLSPAYSICCGNASMLSNNDVEYDVAFNLFTPGLSSVQEVTQEPSPQLEWQMNIHGPLAYRAFRIPSLYPGVEWSQAEIATSETAASKARAQATFDTKQP